MWRWEIPVPQPQPQRAKGSQQAFDTMISSSRDKELGCIKDCHVPRVLGDLEAGMESAIGVLRDGSCFVVRCPSTWDESWLTPDPFPRPNTTSGIGSRRR
jgi:hypothetical protein